MVGEKEKAAFWRVVFDPDGSDPVRVVGHNLREVGFDFMIFKRGSVFAGEIPPEMRLWVSPAYSEAEDMIANPLGWLIVSEQLMGAWRSIACTDCQEIAAPLYFVGSDVPLSGYKIVNITTVMECIDADKSVPRIVRSSGERRGFIRYKVDPLKVGGANIFKYRDPGGYIDSGATCSQAVLDSMRGMGLTGIGFLRCAGTEEGEGES